MRYYVLEVDRGYLHTPKLKHWYRQLDIQNMKKGVYDSIPKRTLFQIEEHPDTVFVDVIVKPFLLVSNAIKECLELYEPNLTFKEFILLDSKYRKTKDYYLPTLRFVDCLTSNCKFNLDHSELFYIELDKEKVGERSIFVLQGVSNQYVVVRLDVLESFLLRGATGFLGKEVVCDCRKEEAYVRR